jgi:hypothetical protein
MLVQLIAVSTQLVCIDAGKKKCLLTRII